MSLELQARPENLSNSFIKQRERNIRKMMRDLEKTGLIGNISGAEGVDLGSWYGMSAHVLSELGADVIAVEQAGTALDHAVNMGMVERGKGFSVKAESFLQEYDGEPLDFITFFAATKAADLESIVQLGKENLTDGGFILITAMGEMGEEMESLLSQGGVLFTPRSDYWWDKVGYLWRNE